MTEHLHVITGGPGSGKSTLIAHFAAAGFVTMPEAGRAIIQDQVAIGGSALPWADPAAFAEQMLTWELRSHREARKLAGPVLFDRSIADVIAFLLLCDLPVPTHVRRAAERYRYNRRVFIAPFWPDIYAQDGERKQSLAEAEAQFHILQRVYADLGYELVPLPFALVEERADFIRAHLDAQT